jgi:deferrochelatase/peroxidase EfeB
MPELGLGPTTPDPGNVQGLVAYRYEQPLSAILLFRIVDPAGARTFVRAQMPRVSRGDQDSKTLKGPVLNFAFTWGGLGVLLKADPQLDIEVGRHQLDFAFTDQTPEHPAVRDQLGFIHDSAPENWWGGAFANADVHMALYAACDDAGQMTQSLAELRASAAQSGLVELKVPAFADGALTGYRPAGGFVHFGYRDGVTTPVVDWKDEHTPGKVNFREFLMGYPQGETYPVSPQDPGPWRDFACDGSFACLTWIYQDVATFNRFLDTNAPLANGHAAPGQERQWIAAKLLGRWPDGSALALHPKAPPATPDFSDAFGFKDDPGGLKCPLSSHIRVANVRDQELTFPNQSRFPNGPPRFIRRGFSYGPTLDQSQDDGVDRGLVGTFICARVNEQFYTALRWIQKTDFAEDYFRKPYAGAMQEGLFGNRRRAGASVAFPIPVEGGPALSAQLADFIAYKGVAVFFLPSLEALARLA